MNRKLIPVFLAFVSLSGSAAQNRIKITEPVAAENTPTDNWQRAAKLVAQMTLEEKIGQMAQIGIDVITRGQDMPPASTLQIDVEKLRAAVVKYHVGSIFSAPNTQARTAQWWNAAVAEIQRVAMTETRMKIPVLYALDQNHGGTYTAGSTMFPAPIALAASWNPVHARCMGEITAYETRASNVPWTFSPTLDLGLDPRWARQNEDFGEDPYLGAIFGAELTKGLQGENADNIGKNHIAACAKHFLGYGATISGKDRTPAYIPENVMFEYHIPAFQAALDAGVVTFMINSGIVNNRPSHADYHLITNILRKQMGFRGMVVSDYEDINKLYFRDHMVGSIKGAIREAINAGIDMSIIPANYVEFCTLLKELVEEGQVPAARIDEAATRILKLKLDLNLFETPNTFLKDYPEFHSEKFQNASYDAAADAITLLKNKNGILPLKKGKKILVVGPNATSMRPLNGGWTFSWQGEKADEFVTDERNLLQAIELKYGKENVKYIAGVSYNHAAAYDAEYKDRFDEAISAAQNADIVLLMLGENSYCEKPGDLNDLYLSDLQTDLAQKITEKGKPTILVLSEGRPRLISKFSHKVEAIVQTYLPGMYGADALADVLAGDVNPSGKLPYTYPAFPNSLVPYYHKYAEEQKNTDATYQYESDYNYEFPFGFGLSYTTFEYGNAKISAAEQPLNENTQITISVEITNTGEMAGKEIVQLYSADLFASLAPDVKRLRRFEKVALAVGETKTVTFTLRQSDLAFVDFDNKKVIEKGDFEFQIGASSADIKARLAYKIK
ncbi:MAG: glycoside hydrolase family 3 C-terminal domain-containing protein [Dysgonamonadaceae bacterium]|nr:glycoside hydrolase family 3 C-terminal domain-containing protein [Dysgonamonadaceae bacterium]